MLPTKFWFIWPSGFRGEDFQKSTNQKQELPVAAILLMNRDEMSNLIEDLPRMLPTKFRFIWQAVSEEKIFQKSTNQKQEWPVAAMFVNGSGRNEQSLKRTCHRCFLPSFGSFGQAVSEEKILKNWPIRNKNCLWWPCLLMYRDRIGPSIDASYQVSLHLTEWFQRRRLKCEKLMDDR